MNKVFEDLIGRNMEVYVDDMVIKSRTVTQAQGDLRETLEQLRFFLQNAPLEWGLVSSLAFWYQGGGLPLTPKKVQAVIDMAPPRNIKEVLRLTGCLAALNRFLSRSADRQFSFFQL